MNAPATVPEVDIQRALTHLANPAEVPIDQLVNSFCWTLLRHTQPIPFQAARDVLERRDLKASHLEEIGMRFGTHAARFLMPDELPTPDSRIGSVLKIALTALSFGHQLRDPELNPEAWQNLGAPTGEGEPE